MMKKLLLILTILFTANAQAEYVTASTIFPLALQNGWATIPLAQMNAKYAALAEKLKQSTKNDGEVLIQAKRLLWFKQQNHCGRIQFDVAQPTSSTEWPQLGGELNVCEDGTPPLRHCKNNPDVLVPFNELCSDRSLPIDTDEVAEVMKDIKQRGQLTPEQAVAKQANAKNQKGLNK